MLGSSRNIFRKPENSLNIEISHLVVGYRRRLRRESPLKANRVTLQIARQSRS
jgi:hypothetical protein